MMAELQIYRCEWNPKPCDICGESKRLRILGDRTEKLYSKNGYYEFIHKDTICKRCGFIFNGLIPEPEFLDNYYRNTSIKVVRDYDAGARLHLIDTLIKKHNTILEIGSGDGAFVKFLNRDGYRAEAYDIIYPNKLSKKTYDLVVAYYVMEHMPEPRTWLKFIASKLTNSSKLIIEVPNFNQNPEASLHPEHFLHFGPNHLLTILTTEGFQVRRIIHGHSRKFGIAAVAVLNSSKDVESRYNKVLELRAKNAKVN